MKPRIIIITALFIYDALVCLGQQWVGSLFNFDTSIVIESPHIDLNTSRLKYCIDEGTLYYTDIQSYQNKETDYAAVINTVSLYDYTQSEIQLAFPSSISKKEKNASSFWINDFNFHNGQVVISTQNQILLYHQTADSQFEYDTLFRHTNVKATYLYKGSLYYLEEDHDTGYKWFRQSLSGGDETLIRELRYEAPHVVQANPNRYLFHNENYLFFLSTRHPILHKYSLDGIWLEDISFDLPDWHPFEDAYIQMSLTFPYGVERIQATMREIFQYSYPKYVFPFGETQLLYYTQFDTNLHRSAPQFALLEKGTGTRLYVGKDTCRTAYDNHHFPFNLFNTYEDKARISWNNLLVEITADGIADWRGKTPENYQQQQDIFYKHNDPVFKIRTYKYKNTFKNETTEIPFFIDTDQKLHSLDNLPYGKSILLVTNQLDCSACKKHILQLFNDSSSASVNIGILLPYIPGALQERELGNSIKQHLEKPFRLFYLTQRCNGQYPKEIFPDGTTYPAILLHETGKAPILIPLENIFVEDVFSMDFKQEFLKIWNSFNSD